MKEERPWGYYESLQLGTAHQVKFLLVKAGERLSYQRHRFRAEHWVILSGKADVTLNGEHHILTHGDSIDIPVGALHRIEALLEPVTFVEVQTGSYLGEDDIERLDDDYGRSSHE